MRKILFDFLTLHSKNGAAEYTRRVFGALLKMIYKVEIDSMIYCLYDSSSMPQYEELLPDKLKDGHVAFVDVNEGVKNLNELGCDVFFFGCAQNGNWHPELQQLRCKSIIVFHDCVWEELYNNDLSIYMTLNTENVFRHRATKPVGNRLFFDLKSPTIRFCRWLFHVRKYGILEKGYTMVQPSLSLFRKREDNIIITVSEYSKHTLMYNFDIPETKIQVKYSPERVYENDKEDCESENLKLLLEQKKNYYLLVSAGRVAKNAKKTLMAFQHYTTISPDSLIVTIGYGKKLFENHIDLPFLRDSDLQMAYAHCFALIYPSYFEGFGYPPLEAMKFGKPVLSSNVCSMPEVLGDAPIYFSPFYESAIFGALCHLTDRNYQDYSDKSRKQYTKVHERQEKDLDDLIHIILSC
jgi:glycosyltransferase involved in cell wall biosynthesis